MPERPGVLRLAGAGWSALWRLRRLVFPVYLVNLGAAIFAILPAYVALVRLTAHRPTVAPLAHGWDLALLAELAIEHPALLDAVRGAFLFAPLFYLLLSQLLLGGVLGALSRPEKRPTLRAFGSDAAGSWLRLIGVLLWAVLPYGLAGAALWGGWVLSRGAAGWLRGAALLPGGLVVLAAAAALDLARVAAVVPPERAAWRAWRAALGQLARRPVAAVLLEGGFGLLGLGIAAAAVLLPDALDAGSAVAVLLALLLRQVLVFGRVAVRVAGLGALCALGSAALPAGQALCCGEPVSGRGTRTA